MGDLITPVNQKQQTNQTQNAEDEGANNTPLRGRRTKKNSSSVKQPTSNLAAGISTVRCDGWMRPADVQTSSSLPKHGASSSHFDAQANPLANAACQILTNPLDSGQAEAALRAGIDEAIEKIDARYRIPGDLLPAIEADLLTQLPHDPKITKIVRDQAEAWSFQWRAEGRTHEVWDTLLKLSKEGDWQGITKHVSGQIRVLAQTSPTKEAVDHYKAMLVRWSDGLPPKFNEAASKAFDQYFSGPTKAAQQVAQIYREKGAAAAVLLLHELTDFKTVDPLKAALIFNEALPTIEKITDEALSRENIAVKVAKAERILKSLSAICDNASRSGEPTPGIKEIGKRLADDIVKYATDLTIPSLMAAVKASVAEGHAILAFELIEQLNRSRNAPVRNVVIVAVMRGIKSLHETTRDSVLKLGKTILPLANPMANWGPLVGNADDIALKWINSHPDYEKNVRNDLARINLAGYKLTRILQAANTYLPRLNRLNSVDVKSLRTLTEVPDPKKDPALAYALAISPQSQLETARLASLDLLALANHMSQKKLVPVPDPARIAVDTGWAMRAGRGSVRSIIALLTGKQIRFGFGLCFFGTITYVQGAVTFADNYQLNHGMPGFRQFDAVRAIVLTTMYGVGGFLEGVVAASDIVNNVIKASETDPSWKGAIARIAANKGIWPRLLTIHSTVFGGWLGVSSVYSLLHGDWARGAALGIAAAGNFLSKFPAAVGLSAEIGGPLGLTAGFIAAFALYLMSEREKEKAAHATEPYNEAFLKLAGYGKIAHELAKNNDKGESLGPVLLGLSQYLNINPKSLLPWLTRQDTNWLGLFIKGARQIIRHDDGSVANEIPGRNFSAFINLDRGWGWREFDGIPMYCQPDELRPLTLKGLKQWAAFTGHPLPENVNHPHK